MRITYPVYTVIVFAGAPSDLGLTESYRVHFDGDQPRQDELEHGPGIRAPVRLDLRGQPQPRPRSPCG
jgi:hypothetical protein